MGCSRELFKGSAGVGGVIISGDLQGLDLKSMLERPTALANI